MSLIYRKIFFRVFFVLLIFFLGTKEVSYALSSTNSQIAVLKSAKNLENYQSQNLGSYEEDWQSFKRTIDSASIRYDIVKDEDLVLNKLTQYKILVLPFLLDISNESLENIKQYINSGGKLLITDGCGQISNKAAQVYALAGAVLDGHKTIEEAENLVWSGDKNYSQEFAVGTLIACLNTPAAVGSLANWKDIDGKVLGAAITKQNGSVFMGWAPGLQGETASNATIISMLLDEVSPGLSKTSTVQIDSSDYTKYLDELETLQKRTEEAMSTAKQADLAVAHNLIQKHYDEALVHAKAFREFYGQKRSYEADSELNVARNEFSLAFAQSMPVNLVEARSIWLDRGTIVACQNQAGMSSLFDKLQKSGINVVYFETNNAGFTMFPSKVSCQNPQVEKWDPLNTAISEAHRRGMELHAWFWTFNVGNTFHNPIVSKDADFPGPVLSQNRFEWALQSNTGSLIPPKQHEFWIDPSCSAGRKFIKDLASELVSKYDLDGIQLDYIRYPFNGKGGEMGFDWTGRLNFERETKLCLDKLDEKTRKTWIEWKIKQINSLVQDISNTVRSIKPGIRVSAAVYAMPRAERLNSIQQDWETWVSKGWVDTLNPMTYVTKGAELQKMASSVRQSSENKAFVFPGLFIKDLDTAAFVEQLYISRCLGTMGNTMFAVAQLDDKKQNLLQIGPYRKSSLMTPQSNPIRASVIIFDNFAKCLNRYIQDPERPIISDRALTNDIIVHTELIQKKLHALPNNSANNSSLSLEEITLLSDEFNSFDNILHDWLSIESFIHRESRAKYMTDFISQIKACLNYALHQSKLRDKTKVLTISKQTKNN